MATLPEYQITPIASLFSDEMPRAIGGLFLACAAAENALRFVLTQLHHPQGGATMNTFQLLAGMEIGVTLEKITVGAFLAKPTSRKEISSICEKIRAIFQRRNEIAHNTAITGSGDRLVLALTKITSTGKITVSKTFNTAQINKFAADLFQYVRHLSERLHALGIAKLPEELEIVQVTAISTG